MSKATQRLYDIILGAQNGKLIEEFDPPLKAKEIEFYKSVQEDCARIRAEGREPMFEIPVDYEPDDEDEEDNNTCNNKNVIHDTNSNQCNCEDYPELKHLGFTSCFEDISQRKPYALSNAAVNNDPKYRIIDDELLGELWFALDEEGYCGDFTAVYRSDNRNKLSFDYWHKDKENQNISRARLTMLNDYDIPINIEIADALALEDLKEGDEVLATITCFPCNVNFFEDEESCKEDNKGLDVESCIPIGTFPDSEDMAETFIESAHAAISGKVKSYEERTNKLTGLKYVHFAVESLGMVYDVVVARDKVSSSPEKVQYISGVFYLTGHIDTQNYQRQGNSWQNDYTEKLNEEEFDYEVADTMETLRDMPYEHFIADFSQSEGYPVEFIQTAIYDVTDKGKNYLIEYGKPDSEGKPLLYRLVPENDFCSFDMAVKIFYAVCVEGKEPLDWHWKDVTYIIREDKQE